MPGFLKKIFGGGDKNKGSKGKVSAPSSSGTASLGSNSDNVKKAKKKTKKVQETPVLDQASKGGAQKRSFNPFRRKSTSKDSFGDKDVKSIKSLGGGTANDVHKVRYKHEIGKSGTKDGYFKGTSGNEAAKSIASGRVDRLIGTNVLSTDVQAEHQGVKGVTSAQVPGEAMSRKMFENDATEQMLQLGDGSFDDAAKQIQEMGMTAQLKVDRDNQKIMGFSGDDYKDVDFRNPEVQKGLADLQLIDYLTGQRDRHEGNIFVDDKTGKVTGIDNDMSFNGGDTGEAIERGVGFDTKQLGLPSQIDAMTGLRVLHMDESEFLGALVQQQGDESALTEQEIEAALDRFRHLKQHIDNQYMMDELVYDWNDGTYEEASQNKQSYLGRAVHERNRG